MVHVAQEMERQEFRLPLVDRRRDHEPRAYRGENRAALSGKRRARARCFARRRRGEFASQIRTTKLKFDATTRADYERLRNEYANRNREKKMLTLEQAQANGLTTDWTNYEPPVPEFLGVRSYSSAAEQAGRAREGSFARDAGRVYRLVALFSHLGIARTLSGDLRG